MPIEFRCPQCQKLLRVPDESAGAKARCPQCSAIVDVPAQRFASSGSQETPGDLPPAQVANPFAQDTSPLQPTAKPASSDPVNPYSSPAASYESTRAKPFLSSDLEPTSVDAGSVISYAWEVWKSNLGILVGITVVVIAVNFGFGAVQGVINAIFEQQGNAEVGAIFSFVISIFSNLVQIYLGIGQAQIVLKLLRGQNAEFGELFGGGPLFLPVFGAAFLAGLALIVGMIACIVPGILLMLFFWPFYWLVVDRKAAAIESFGMALPFGQANVGTTFVLWLASVGIMLAGFLALCVGVVFAAPLVSLLWGTAYLMMSGQLRVKPQY
ncbi:MAG TPA: hypothetical protein VMM76_15775 [Pirellulaceae bacterium]|nr:hypothetical protein [Pirellulaceae bacterium]